uniref:Syntrophin C-terminal PH domain-containing protein n=2 Tax=Amphimedon queenslandica TaxID=400682 RepID=A0A1X7SGC0_AMPQE
VDELKGSFDLEDLILVCWVNELMVSSKQCRVWMKRLLVLRNEELEIYSDFPETAGDWQSPELHYGVCDITWGPLVKNGTNSHIYRPHSISLQSSTGGRHILSFECDISLHYWERELLMEIKDVVMKINARTFAAKWEGNAVDLTIDLQKGFIIEDSTTATKHWTKKFEELESSSDNGSKELYLTFKDGVKQCLELTELHAVLYTIEAFLKTRVSLL